MSARSIKGKYQLKTNLYAACQLTMLRCDDSGVELHLGVRADELTTVPAGTRIQFDIGQLCEYLKQPAPGKEALSLAYVTVQTVGDARDPKKLLCSAIQWEHFEDRRRKPRQLVDFQVTNQANTRFMAMNATLEGMQLEYQSRQVIISLKLDQVEAFLIIYKGKPYPFQGRVKHIQYDWHHHHHRVGVEFSTLADEQQTILNFLVDPNYTVAIPEKQTVDVTYGKISADLDD
jgi:hypothetical protein